MSYLPDRDLEFLKFCTHEDLGFLVNQLTQTSGGKQRISSKMVHLDRFKTHFPQHKKYWNLIAGEIQIYGGHAFANIFAGSGVSYRSILKRVCKKLNVSFSDEKSTEANEVMLLSKVMMQSLERLTFEELQALVDQFQVDLHANTKSSLISEINRSITLGKITPRLIATLLTGSLAKFAFNRSLKYGLLKFLKIGASKWFGKALTAFTGPIGLAFTLTWLIHDLFGPDYKILVPIVIHIAFLRIIYKEQGKTLQAA
ncbi:DUF3944 domain-containing protein [Flammeovirgaceae bacterium SG7u.111]|nr:DUF3944 domain-containing protein [Flammeovirgaceae bacterium SG7u.132]WPO35289.1 DUF3944 domain-containing protein [Flammeovirgaceae bacterium SG7u.111]